MGRKVRLDLSTLQNYSNPHKPAHGWTPIKPAQTVQMNTTFPFSFLKTNILVMSTTCQFSSFLLQSCCQLIIIRCKVWMWRMKRGNPTLGDRVKQRLEFKAVSLYIFHHMFSPCPDALGQENCSPLGLGKVPVTESQRKAQWCSRTVFWLSW